MAAPEPPIPPDADLRHMPSYMIDVQALLDSDLAAFGDPAANWYAVLSWCASLHQVPAGSLPDDDSVLAYLVRLGRDVRTWKKMRDKGSLKGWEKHSDGRLYHPVVTKKVLSLLEKSRAAKAATAAREAKKKAQVPENTTCDNIERSSGDGRAMTQKGINRREGKGIEGKEREEKETEQDSVAIATDATASIDYRQRLFREGLSKLSTMTGKNPNACRSFIGKCLKAADDDAVIVLRLIEDAERNRVADPSAWIAASLKSRGKFGSSPSKAESAAEGISAYFRAKQEFQNEQSRQNQVLMYDGSEGHQIGGD